MPSNTKWFVAILLILGMAIAASYLWYRASALSLDGYYTETDGFMDARGLEIASVHFVSVESYDSLKIMRVAETITRETIERGTLDINKKRRFLFHFFVASDTSALTQEMIDELAYISPEIEEPSSSLYAVSSGYVVQATFAPKMMQPQLIESRRSQFYMPRPGIRAQSVK